LIGLGFDHTPRFARRYAQVGEIISRAVAEYGDDVRNGGFPSDEESFHLPAETRERLHTTRHK
jgi:3-methyl-2-oxobutanoate hydroxymethyltransferase